MKVHTSKATRRNASVYYLGIAFLIISLSISEFLVSRVFLQEANDDAHSMMHTFGGNKVINGINRAKKRFRKRKIAKKVGLPSSKQNANIDKLCPYCRYGYVNQATGPLTCGKKIIGDWHLHLGTTHVESNATFLKGAVSLANNVSMNGACRRCNPSSCTTKDKQYYRIDNVAPSVKAATTHFLQSIPAKHRIPKDALKNLTAYFSDEDNVHPARKYFFEFNPSIVRLPESQKTIHNAAYLASFRVSTCHDCVPNQDDYVKMMNATRSSVSHTEYLGLAILDKHLAIVQETVVNMKQFMFRFQDPRLFVLNDQLYVGSYQSIRPMWLSTPPTEVERKSIGQLNHVWPDAEVSLLKNVSVGKNGSCSKDKKTQVSGKNLNYFIDSKNDTILEIKAMGPYERMNLSSVCNVQTKTKATFIQSNASKPYPSFGTSDELDLSRQNYYEPIYTDERGSACCVSIQHPNGQALRLGISHSKTVFGNGNQRKLRSNQFFSSFYAFEAESPYKVVARTGRFCFGFATEPKTKNPYVKMQMDTMKMIDVEYKNCPRIHFVSGMVEKADDPTKLIVAYGLNDCVPRMVVIEKSDVLQMLFAPHERMNNKGVSSSQ